MSKLATLLLAVMMVSGLSACGRKASPQPPADALYPVHYPAPASPNDSWVAPRDALETIDPNPPAAKTAPP